MPVRSRSRSGSVTILGACHPAWRSPRGPRGPGSWTVAVSWSRFPLVGRCGPGTGSRWPSRTRCGRWTASRSSWPVAAPPRWSCSSTDDCSRFDLALRAAASENGEDVWARWVLHASSRYGLPARFLTDNGGAFSGRRCGWISRLEENLRALNVLPITSSVSPPPDLREERTGPLHLSRWLRHARPAPEDLPGLQEPARQLPRPVQHPATQDPPERDDPRRALRAGT